MQWSNSTLNSNVNISFTSPSNLESNISLMTNVYPETLNDSILKISNSVVQLQPGTYRIEAVLKVSYTSV